MKYIHLDPIVFEHVLMDLLQLYQDELQALQLDDELSNDVKVICNLESLKRRYIPKSYIQKVFGLYFKKEHFNNPNQYPATRITLNFIVNEKAKQLHLAEHNMINVGDYFYKAIKNFDEQKNTVYKMLPYIFQTITGCNTLGEYIKKRQIHSGPQISDTYAWFYGTHLMYFYNNEASEDNQASFVNGIMEVTDLQNIRIYNYAYDRSVHYFGSEDTTMDPVDNILYLKFSPISSGYTSNLRMAFYFNTISEAELYLGHYTNKNDEGKLIRGTIALVPIEFSRDWSVIDQEEFKNITREIIQGVNTYGISSKKQKQIHEVNGLLNLYFQDKARNFHSITRSATTVNSFSAWIKQKRNYIEEVPIRKIFITCPISSLKDQSDRIKYRKLITTIREHLMHQYQLTSEDIYCRLLEIDKDNLTDDALKELLNKPPKFFKKIFHRLQVSSHHIAIWPKELLGSNSGVLFELGISIATKKPCTIFTEIGASIPKIVEGATNINYSIAKRIDYHNFDELIEELKESSSHGDIFNYKIIKHNL